MNKTRISKEPEIRKNEILDVAAELFLTRGFDETTVSDIVNKVGVAQGLFYYYFKSKDEVLDQVVDRFAENYLTPIYEAGNDNTLNSVQKIKIIFFKMLFPHPQDEKIFHYVHQERNEILHHRMAKKWLEGIVSLFMNIIEQGVREKLFDVEYPRETLEIMMNGFEPYFHNILRQSHDLEQYTHNVRAGLAVLEKALGAAKGSLQIDDFNEIGENNE